MSPDPTPSPTQADGGPDPHPGQDDPAPRRGLSAAQVADAVRAGRTNAYQEPTSRSAREILRANVFTVFNAILGAALVVILAVGSWRDALFGFVLLINTATGTVAEIRAKRALDSLSVLAAPLTQVIRDGTESSVGVAEVVLGDLIRVSSGDQVPADGVVVEQQGVEIDESILTGESATVRKEPGDRVMSGTTVTAGTALVTVDAVGADAYAHRLAAEARRYSVVTSELQAGTNRVLTWISWVIVPMTLLLLWSQMRVAGGWSAAWANGGWRHAVVLAVAGVVGMVPQGLVLLTSVNFAAASLSLARQHVLVQELPAVEVLARVDTLCLDKTGTLTSGGVELQQILGLDDHGHLVGPAGPQDPSADGQDGSHGRALAALAAMVGGEEANATARAVAAGLSGVTPAQGAGQVPFSSARKWSALAVEEPSGRAHYVLGAPEIVLAPALAAGDDAARATLEKVSDLAGAGQRVLCLARSTGLWYLPREGEPSLPEGLHAVVLAVLAEEVRPDAARTLGYFAEQGVTVKIISGDNPTTVAAIARGVGVRAPDGGQAEGVDARVLPDAQEEEGRALADALEAGAVFGRVTPEQKRDFVRALRSRGHVVAMTGDGVNDALALKDADLGIAMGNAAPATKAVARLVLLDGRFASLPGVVAEGRRVIANMERVASLFLAKTTYAALIAVVVALAGISYPYLPRQLTIVSSLTIGIPATVIALAPTHQRYRPGFLGRVLRLAVPAGLVIGAGVLVTRTWLSLAGAASGQVTTGATLVLVLGGLWLLSGTARPWVWWRVVLVVLMAAAALMTVFLEGLRSFFDLAWPAPLTWVVLGTVGAGVCLGVELVAWWASRAARRTRP
ncbi:HAD-IC family P-type ATPase [uncultured Actinomyces sp.]|uniref:HAD-IC family P-type ATPase n=1 Tax=uncultured Actinomyces sp. TaxID=249061 RepID=UPI0028E72D76|nr:HAD-IC family P-type ATPase [uncultured Actinomyces sp.]